MKRGKRAINGKRPDMDDHRTPGFTLPEVLITILLISILFSLGIVFSSSFRQTRKMRDYEIAIVLAQQAIDILRAAPFDTIDDKDEDKFEKGSKFKSVERDLMTKEGENDPLVPIFEAGNIKYERNVEVLDVPPAEKDGPSPGLKHVRVSVSWKSPEGEYVPPFEITTMITDLN